MKNITVIGALFLLSGCGNSSSKIISEKSGEKKVEPPQERYNNPLDPYDASLILQQPLEEWSTVTSLFHKRMGSLDVNTIVDFPEKVTGDWQGIIWKKSNVRIYWRFESNGKCRGACIQHADSLTTGQYYSRIFGNFSMEKGLLLVRLSEETSRDDLDEFLKSCGSGWETERGQNNTASDWILKIPIRLSQDHETSVMMLIFRDVRNNKDGTPGVLFKK